MVNVRDSFVIDIAAVLRFQSLCSRIWSLWCGTICVNFNQAASVQLIWVVARGTVGLGSPSPSPSPSPFF